MYELVNIFIPASVFITIISNFKIFNFDFFAQPLLCQITILFITGYVLSRIGSVIVQPVMELLKIINMQDYKNYLKYTDKNIKVMQCTANEYRTYIALFGVLYVIHTNSSYIRCLWLFIVILFGLSYKKQMSFIQKRLFINANKEDK